MFGIPLPAGRWAIAQVLAATAPVDVVVAVFNSTLGAPSESAGRAIAHVGSAAMVAPTMDARLRSGDWPTLGVQDVRDDLPLPVYSVLVGYPPVRWLVDFDGSKVRPLAEGEGERLRPRGTHTPGSFELAVRALHGEAESPPLFDRDRVDNLALRSSFRLW